MDAIRRTRQCCRTRKEQGSQESRGSKQMCLSLSRETFDRIWDDPKAVRTELLAAIEQSPELFPAGIEQGFRLTGHGTESIKLPGIRLRQLRLKCGGVYWLRPSFVMPYMTGFTKDMEYPLRLMQQGVSGWLVAEHFGHDGHFWDRQVERLGRNSLVGTTVKDPAKLPEHVVGDEHLALWCGHTGYVALTVGCGCFLGAALTESADEEHLTAAYGTFASEARDVASDYAPQTVNTDGWTATQNAFRKWFPTIVVVLCFLHGFLKIRDRGRKSHELHRRVWEVYRAENAADFAARMQTFQQQTEAETWPATVKEVLAKLWNKASEYARAYSHPHCHRTSNMVDRLTNRLYRILYAHRGLHGHQATSELRLRGHCLLYNFCPFAPRAGKPRQYHSPAHRLNQKRYHDNWLENLMISASLGGFRRRT